MPAVLGIQLPSTSSSLLGPKSFKTSRARSSTTASATTRENMTNLPPPFSTIPFHRLSYAQPSPIHLLPGLSNYVRGDRSQPHVKLWAKRDDQAGPLVCYGNKYRKFEYIIPDILAKKDVTTVVTEGALQSNHTVQTASMARTIGLKATVLLHRGVGGGFKQAIDQESFARLGNVHLNRLLGADVRITAESDTGDEHGPLIPVLDELRAQGHVPYWLPSGASLHPLGGLGYARCAFEIAEQQADLIHHRQLEAPFDYVFVACGSGSTLAGLIAGFKLREMTTGLPQPKVIGVMTSPTKSKSYQEERILRLARTTANLIGLNPEQDVKASDVSLVDTAVGDAYGVLDTNTAHAIDLSATSDSFLLDPVYTGKVMRAMLDWAVTYLNPVIVDPADQGNRTPANALFLHTGGQSALGAYADVWPGNSARPISIFG